MVAPASAPPPVLPMTATEAWRYLARLWDCAVEDEAGAQARANACRIMAGAA